MGTYLWEVWGSNSRINQLFLNRVQDLAPCLCQDATGERFPKDLVSSVAGSKYRQKHELPFGQQKTKNWCYLKSWKSLNIVLAKVLRELKRCDGNGLIGNWMQNKKRIIVITVWQLCKAYSRWQSLKSAIFQYVITNKSSGGDGDRGVRASQEIVCLSAQAFWCS